MKLKVKCLHEGYYNESRIDRGEVFYIKNESEFSHLWMKAVGWTPKAAEGIVKDIMDSPDHKAKSMEFKPFDAKTHGKRNARGDEDFQEFDHKAPPDGEVSDEDAEPASKKKGPRGKDVI